MKFLSTRGGAPPVTFTGALRAGLAPDGGLYVPERFPSFAVGDFDELVSLPAVGARLLAPFFAGDPLEDALEGICDEAFSFPAPLTPLGPDRSVLELFHGPTAAFKDVGARFLVGALSRLTSVESRPATVIVATSGDTGGAVAAAFHGRPGFEVVILFPKGKVSPRQEKQLTSWGGNVQAFAVNGDFDDCQRMVKAAFADPAWRDGRRLVSANSINVGRLLPQMAYYAAASLAYLRSHGAAPGFVVPSGNLGNAVAALWAKASGLPIREVVLATNANHAVVDYFAGGEWKPHPTIATLANAMDVGNPSNMERLLHLYPERAALARDVRALSVSDADITAAILALGKETGRAFCPHTATALFALDRVGGQHWIVVATAHPAKFDTIVEPLLGRAVELPPALAAILAKPAEVTEISADLGSLNLALCARR